MAEVLPSPQAHKVITCILPAGRGQDVLARLRAEKGFVSASVHHARGVGGATMRRRRRARFFTEKDVLVALVPADQADALFEFIYFAAGINEPHAGMLFMERAFRACGMVPPVIGEEGS